MEGHKKTPQNILILHGSSDLYGASKIILNVAEVLSNHQFSVFFILSEDGPLVEELRKLNVEVHFCKLGILRRKYFSVKGILNRLLVLQNARKEISAFIKEKDINIIYSNTTAVLIGVFLSAQHKRKHIWHIHEIFDRPAILKRFIGWTLQKYDSTVICVSQAVKKSWEKYITNRDGEVIYNGLDCVDILNAKPGFRESCGIKEDEVVIAMVGRVNLVKGQKYFLEIASILSKEHKNIKFVMVGDVYPGNEYLYEELNEIKTKYKLEDVVIDLGYRKDIPEILREIDIFILPSIKPDSLPTAVLEAMAAGKPVVATELGGAKEMIIENSTGFLIPTNDAQIASEKISVLVKSPVLRKTMGMEGKKRASSHFSKAEFDKNILSLFR